MNKRINGAADSSLYGDGSNVTKVTEFGLLRSTDGQTACVGVCQSEYESKHEMWLKHFMQSHRNRNRIACRLCFTNITSRTDMQMQLGSLARVGHL